MSYRMTCLIGVHYILGTLLAAIHCGATVNWLQTTTAKNWIMFNFCVGWIIYGSKSLD